MLRATLVGVTALGLGSVAAPASARGADDEELPNEIVIRSKTNPVKYRIEVSGSIEVGEEAGENDEVGEDSVVGKIDGPNALDNYHFSGVITEFEITAGRADVFVNGKAAGDPVGLPDGANSIVLKALSDRVEYRIEAGESIEAGETAGENDEIDDAAVAGEIDGKGGIDDYAFSGSTLSVEIEKGALAFLVRRGKTTDASDSDDLSDAITVRGLGSTVRYLIAATGGVEFGSRAEEEETDIPADRALNDHAVEGFVHAHGDNPGVDDYRYAGALKFVGRAPLRVEVELGAE